jgi:hypothetical protein
VLSLERRLLRRCGCGSYSQLLFLFPPRFELILETGNRALQVYGGGLKEFRHLSREAARVTDEPVVV